MPLMSGRKRRAEAAAEEESDAGASPVSSPEPATQRRRLSPEDEDYGDGNNAAEDGNFQQLVKKMVRLALACEYQRRPIRRADISEKVLGNAGSRKFKETFNAAQMELRSVFGMEMMELPQRERVTVAQKRAAQKSQSQAAKPIASWILVSTLPADFHDPAILPPPRAPTSDEESRYTAIYTILVSLISLSGGSLPAAKMERYLRRLEIEDNTPVAAQQATGQEKTEKLLKRMEREGYLIRVKESTGQGDDDVYWTVGPRGKVEIGEDGVRGLTKAVYGDLDEGADEELDRKIARSLGLGDAPPPGRGQDVAPQKKKSRRRKDADDDEEEDDSDDD